MHFNYIMNFFTLMFFISTHSFSQDTINLQNGKQIIAKIYFFDTGNTFIKYNVIIKDKLKLKTLDKLDIFSINYADKSQKILYSQDSALGYPLSVSEMEHFMLGGREAMKNYKAPWITVFGFVIGAVATEYLHFWGLSSTIAYPIGAGITGVKIKTSNNVNSDLKSNKDFIDGYKTYATKKKVKNALFGSIIGTATTIIATIIITAK